MATAIMRNVIHHNVFKPLQEDKTVPGAGFIVFREDETSIGVILVQGKSGNFGFPKGCRQKTDENTLDNAFRELQEESGMEPQMFQSFDTSLKEEKRKLNKITGEPFIKVNYYFPGLMNKQHNNTALKYDPDELKSVGWYSLDEAKSKLSNEKKCNLLELAYCSIYGETPLI